VGKRAGGVLQNFWSKPGITRQDSDDATHTVSSRVFLSGSNNTTVSTSPRRTVRTIQRSTKSTRPLAC
jgi:hypothetical protein